MMGEPVELHDIIGSTLNDTGENAYEFLQASIDEGQYENLRINTVDGPSTGTNTVSDNHTRNKGNDSVVSGSVSRVQCCQHVSTVRQLQILCAVLLTIVIISSGTIGVLIKKQDSRIAVIEIDKQTLLSAKEDHEKRLNIKVDGHWTNWSFWSSCSVTCGSGHQTRQRSCTNPSPGNGGQNCTGTSTEQVACQSIICPVNGGWSSWSTWSTCTRTCNTGQKQRHRTCANPAPVGMGRTCTGNSDELANCNENPCTVNGGWSSWSTWSACSKTCNTGQKRRSRTCNNPAPAGFGRDCSGNSDEISVCNETPCSVKGHWADWSFWSSCSVTCGSGQQTRQRSCSNPSPVNGGQMCPGSNTEQMACQAVACPVNGVWSSWSTWSACSKTCDTGQKRRNRTCNNPAPAGFGRDCSGNSDEMSVCNERPCPDPMSAFAIYGYSPTYNSSSRVVVFPITRLNIGNHYSTVTGQYTCYYPGVYVFSLNLYKKSGASRVYCYIRKNNSLYAKADVPSESELGYYESSASTIFHLNRGDTVYVGNCSNPDGIHSYTSFTGFLLKAD